MNYHQLIAEHDAIESAAMVVASLADADSPRPRDVAKALEMLALLLRQHLAGEDETIYQTILIAQGGRHAEAARRMGEELETLKDAWVSYLYRWDLTHVSANWAAFADETAIILDCIRERITFESMVLYSLALHLDVITVD